MSTKDKLMGEIEKQILDGLDKESYEKPEKAAPVVLERYKKEGTCIYLQTLLKSVIPRSILVFASFWYGNKWYNVKLMLQNLKLHPI